MAHPKVIANWKMNGSLSKIHHWLYEFQSKVDPNSKTESIFCPPTCYLSFAKNIISENRIGIYLGAQDLDFDRDFSLTGGINASMLKDIGCDFIILGHSERRSYFFEDDSILLQKLNSAVEKNLKIIFCVGETKEEKNIGVSKEIIRTQLSILKKIPSNLLLLAYEPLWAIGTGEVPHPEYIQEMHETIKDELKSLNDSEIDSPVLYGGSVNEDNAPDIIKIISVDGLLVGGASLDADNFSKIVNKITG